MSCEFYIEYLNLYSQFTYKFVLLYVERIFESYSLKRLQYIVLGIRDPNNKFDLLVLLSSKIIYNPIETPTYILYGYYIDVQCSPLGI